MTTIKETADEKEVRIHNEMKPRPMPKQKENKDYIENPIYIMIKK